MDCINIHLPPMDADDCADLNGGQITDLYFGKPGHDFADWTQLAEWTARLDNATLDDDTKIRHLNVIGSKSSPDRAKVPISKGRTWYGKAKHTIPFKLDDTGATNYAVLRWLEKNPSAQITVWFANGKYLNGGNKGILATVTLGNEIPESDEELNIFVGEVTWTGDHSDRCINPLA